MVLIGRLRSSWVGVPGGSRRGDHGGAVQCGRRGGEDGSDWWVQAVSERRRASGSRARTCGRATDMWGIVVGRRRARRLKGWRRQAGLGRQREEGDVRADAGYWARRPRWAVRGGGKAGRLAGLCGERKWAYRFGLPGLGWFSSFSSSISFPFLFLFKLNYLNSNSNLN